MAVVREQKSPGGDVAGDWVMPPLPACWRASIALAIALVFGIAV
jgi:hypothetical protein